MKAITLTQPHATLMAIGAKIFETRSWQTSHRGETAIHAAQGLGPVGGRKGLAALCNTEPFRSVLLERFWWPMGSTADFLYDPAAYLPLGCILATVRFYDIVPTFELGGTGPEILSDQERAFGDYSAGRYAWLSSNLHAFSKPIKAKGALSLWEWDGATIT